MRQSYESLTPTIVAPPPLPNLCKKVPGKKVSGKKPGNTNFGKKSEFSQVKNVTGNKVLCFGFLGLFS